MATPAVYPRLVLNSILHPRHEAKKISGFIPGSLIILRQIGQGVHGFWSDIQT